MIRRRGTAIAGALLALLAVAGCGLGPGDDVGSVELTVTRDFGAEPMLQRSVGDVAESDTVMRVLERNAEIETRYGGGFVHSIEGIEAEDRGGPRDWFFYVDGVESPVGAADYPLEGGERIWWDRHDWGATNHIPAVVGSWPAPFTDGYGGRSYPVAVECRGGGDACATVRERLGAAGVEPASGSPPRAIRVLVGPWARLRSDPAAAQIESGVEESGVFAEFEREGSGYRLMGLDPEGDAVRDFGPGAGLVAATRRYEAPPVWVVTGAAAAGVRAAANLLDATGLRDRFAVAVEAGEAIPLPLERGG